MKGSLIILLCFVLGAVCGIAGWWPEQWHGGEISKFTLCMLMACVGVGMGSDVNTLRSFRHLNPRIALLPVCTIVGTLAGAVVANVFFPERPLTQSVACASGMAYYSLSSIFITEYIGAEQGTVALLTNIIREMITLLCAPLLCKVFGRLAPISAGGATTMDTTLPIIAQTSGRDYVVPSIYHGFMTDFSVPFLVTFFCML